jgi:hypothetical protein
MTKEPMNAKAEVVAMPAVQVTPLTMLQVAVDRGASVEQLAQLMALQERHEANEARKAFVVALNAFKAAPPTIIKNRTVDFTSTKGRTHYKHAGLEQVSGVIGAALAKVGIAHRWDTEQLEGGAIRVTCVLTHSLGHSERVTLVAKADDSGNKNSIQGVGSTVTYLQRYTLLSATGMATGEAEDDGAGGKGVHEMDPRAKDDFLAHINALTDKKAAEALWATIASECTKCGDVAAYDELKKAVSAKVKAFNKATEI